MDGHYPRREEDRDASVRDSFRESASSYATHVRSSKDPLMKLVNDIAGGAGDLGDRMRRGFGGFTSSQQRPPRDTDGTDGTDGAKGPGGPETPDDRPPRDGS
jgi:CRISPR/Cas system CMR-associated protein Cmr1 (group 7 of RAMP superfamily)